MPTALLHGREVAYWSEGDGEVPILLVHGIGSTAAAWQPVAAELVVRGHRVITVDLPGHGASSKERGDYSLGALASLLRDLLNRLDVSRAVLVGHSLGGGVALQFAYQYPERLAAIALLSSGGLGAETSTVLKLMAMPGSGLVMATAINPTTVGAATALAERWRRFRPPPALLSDTSLARFREIADPDHRNAMLATLRAVMDGSGQRVSAVERLSVLREVPTLIIWGEEDHILPVSHGREAHAALPHSRLEVFVGCAHEPHVDDPVRVALLLDELAVAHRF